MAKVHLQQRVPLHAGTVATPTPTTQHERNSYFASAMTSPSLPSLTSVGLLGDVELDPISMDWFDIGELSFYRMPSLLTTGLATPPLDTAIRSNSTIVARRPSSRLPSTGWGWPLTTTTTATIIAVDDSATLAAAEAAVQAREAAYARAFNATAAVSQSTLTLTDGAAAASAGLVPTDDTATSNGALTEDDYTSSGPATDDDDDEDDVDGMDASYDASYDDNDDDRSYDDADDVHGAIATNAQATSVGISLYDVVGPTSITSYDPAFSTSTDYTYSYDDDLDDRKKPAAIYRVYMGPPVSTPTSAFTSDVADAAAVVGGESEARDVPAKKATRRSAKPASGKSRSRSKAAAKGAASKPRVPGSRRRILTPEEMAARLERARIRQEKNRAAAKICRERKQDHHKVLIVEVQRMRQENARLRMQVAAVAADVAAFRSKQQHQ